MKAGLILSVFLLPIASFAAPAKVFFFGGAASLGNQMKSCYPKYVNLPSGEGSGAVSRIVEEINRPQNRDTEYLIAGHSSGAKFANQVASRAKNPKRIRLVNLDGFSPRTVPKAVNRTCWKATNGKGLWSRNAASMIPANNCGTVKTHTARHCKTQWCLHFAMVNPNVPGDLNDGTWIAQGYKGCRSNSAWVK